MRNAAERKNIRKFEKLAAEADQARINFIVAAMSTAQGRTYFHGILSICNIFDGSFSSDPLLEAFTKGQRNIGLLIYNDIVTHCPDFFVTMMREASIKDLANDRRIDPLPGDDGSADGELSGGEDDNWGNH